MTISPTVGINLCYRFAANYSSRLKLSIAEFRVKDWYTKAFCRRVRIYLVQPRKLFVFIGFIVSFRSITDAFPEYLGNSILSVNNILLILLQPLLRHWCSWFREYNQLNPFHSILLLYRWIVDISQIQSYKS